MLGAEYEFGMNRDAWSAMAGVSLPLWVSPKMAARREAESMVRAADLMLQDKRNEVTLSVHELHYRLRTARRLVRLYEDDVLPRAEKVLRASEADYEAGRAEFLGVIDAQRSLLSFRLAHVRAKVEYRQRLAELERVVGIRWTE
jgi:cobalt-zinc-cadmium efflux system outer membrane protein